MASPRKKLLKNETVQTAIVVLLIVVVVFGFWFGSQIVLNTEIPPALAVVSGSMCIPYGQFCDGSTHPFDRTLHVGDIIIIQGVKPEELNTNYPNSDIIVFHSPDNPSELIVHRIIGTVNNSGTTYFLTKGDGNGNPWPEPPRSSLDPWDSDTRSNPGVSPDLIVGKVILRIPWIGWIAIAMQKAGANSSTIVPVLVLLIVLIVALEFGPLFLKRKPKPKPTETLVQQAANAATIISGAH